MNVYVHLNVWLVARLKTIIFKNFFKVTAGLTVKGVSLNTTISENTKFCFLHSIFLSFSQHILCFIYTSPVYDQFYVCCFKIRMPKVRFVRNLITVPKFNMIRNYLVHENRTFSIVINPSVVLWCSNPCVWLISDSHQGVKREGQLLNGPLPLYLLNPR